MACGVALKRSLDLDPLHSPESVVKRSRLSSYRPAKVTGSVSSPPLSSSSSPSQQPTGALGGPAPSLTPQQLQSYLKAEIKHLRRRKLLPRRNESAGAGASSACPRSPPRSGSSSEDEATKKQKREARTGTKT